MGTDLHVTLGISRVAEVAAMTNTCKNGAPSSGTLVQL